jgi:spore coat polysaccharide biosynthesis protein SpsF (cytidylyltransferase family)
LPGKVFLNFGSKNMLKTVVDRVKYSKKVDEVIVVTSVEPEDDSIANFCKVENILFFRGSLQDVLGRYYNAAIFYGKPRIIVRITADCPFVDASLIDLMLDSFIDSNLDYLANSAPPPGTFPDGLDVEIFTFKALERAHYESFLPSDREHVTFYFWKSGSFNISRHNLHTDFSHLRFTVDYIEDYRVLKNIHERLSLIDPMFNLDSLLEFVALNELVLPDSRLRNSGWETSKARDLKYMSGKKETH